MTFGGLFLTKITLPLVVRLAASAVSFAPVRVYREGRCVQGKGDSGTYGSHVGLGSWSVGLECRWEGMKALKGLRLHANC